ncbi:MAG: DUF1641 domain-containing protein [Candidatus Carbobacillus altaicus]|nr:DUF1641 domain-containing protein [Candidatus Carbobacillus altaicus]
MDEKMQALEEAYEPFLKSLIPHLPELSKALIRLAELEKRGSLDTLLELAEFVSIAKKSMTQPMLTDITRLLVKGVEMADDLVRMGAMEDIQSLIRAYTVVKTHPEVTTIPETTWALARMLRDPDVRHAGGVIITLLKAWGEQMNGKKLEPVKQ